MKNYILILLTILSLGAFAQNSPTLPSGVKPYGNQLYVQPSTGDIWGGNVGYGYKVIAKKKQVDSLIALSYTQSQINSLLLLKADKTYVDAQLALKENNINATTSSDYYRGDKTFQPVTGLPVSTAQQTALNLKSNLAGSNTFTGVNAFTNANPFTFLNNWADLSVTGSAATGVTFGATLDIPLRFKTNNTPRWQIGRVFGELFGDQTQNFIGVNTLDGQENGALVLSGANKGSNLSGGSIAIYGRRYTNLNPSYASDVHIFSGKGGQVWLGATRTTDSLAQDVIGIFPDLSANIYNDLRLHRINTGVQGDSILTKNASLNTVTKRPVTDFQAPLTFNTNDFDNTANTITTDYVNGQKASISLSGYVSTAAQTIEGLKTFNRPIYVGAFNGGFRALGLGSSGGSYPAIGSNMDLTSTSGEYRYSGGDPSSQILFNAGNFQFRTAPTGVAGNVISYTDRFLVSSTAVKSYIVPSASDDVVRKLELDTKANLVGGNTFTGTQILTANLNTASTAVTQAAGTNNTTVATTAFVKDAFDRQTGWAQYVDNAYTSGSPLSVTAGSTVTLTNNAATSIKTQLPTGVTDFYNSGTSKITPQNNGDYYNITIRFKAKNTEALGGYFDFGIDLGGAIGITFKESLLFVKGANTEQSFTICANAYTAATFVANGGIVKITGGNGTTTIYDIDFHINRTHKAK